jgi:hypothetical protein
MDAAFIYQLIKNNIPEDFDDDDDDKITTAVRTQTLRKSCMSYLKIKNVVAHLIINAFQITEPKIL